MPAVYTLSANFFEQLKQHEYSYIASVLFQFTNTQNQYKIAVDTNSHIILKYRELTQDKFYADVIKGWLEMLANIPSSMQKYDVDLSHINNAEDMCIELCSHVNGNKTMIIHSSSSFYKELDDNNTISYNEKTIHIIDKEEAQAQLNNNSTTYITDSMVAGHDIIDSKNNYNK